MVPYGRLMINRLVLGILISLRVNWRDENKGKTVELRRKMKWRKRRRGRKKERKKKTLTINNM